MARVPYADPEDVPEDYRYLLTKTEIGDSPLIRAFANNPPVLQSYMRWGTTLWEDSGVTPRRLELVILTVASEYDAAYEWQAHVATGLDVGLTEEEILAIRAGRFADLDDPDEALAEWALAVVTESVDDATFEAMTEHFDVSTITGTALLAGHYVMTWKAIAALGIEIDGEFVGWELENR